MQRHQYLRTGLVGLLAGVAGCSGVLTRSAPETSKNSEAVEESQGNTTAGDDSEERDETSTHEVEPSVSVRWGEPYTKTEIDLTVLEPTFETVLQTSDATYELDDGHGLAFTPASFHNRTGDRIGFIGPQFTLVSDELVIKETQEVDCIADSEESIDKHEIYRIDRDHRWYSHGTTIGPGESFSTTAVFVIEDDIDPSNVSVRYQPDSTLDEHFDGDVIEWA